jgi:hypothetical protein
MEDNLKNKSAVHLIEAWLLKSTTVGSFDARDADVWFNTVSIIPIYLFFTLLAFCCTKE